jgi:hypothetical protein
VLRSAPDVGSHRAKFDKTTAPSEK